MGNRVVKKTIAIRSSPASVWRVFTDPAVTRQMGGEYLSEWTNGSSIEWKGLDGNMYTSGTILHIIPEQVLSYRLYDLKDKNILLSVITYHFENNDGSTLLHASEELNYPITDEQYNDISTGWDYALNLVKESAEKL